MTVRVAIRSIKMISIDAQPHYCETRLIVCPFLLRAHNTGGSTRSLPTGSPACGARLAKRETKTLGHVPKPAKYPARTSGSHREGGSRRGFQQNPYFICCRKQNCRLSCSTGDRPDGRLFLPPNHNPQWKEQRAKPKSIVAIRGKVRFRYRARNSEFVFSSEGCAERSFGNEGDRVETITCRPQQLRR